MLFLDDLFDMVNEIELALMTFFLNVMNDVISESLLFQVN